jgi:hypothetical protein
VRSQGPQRGRPGSHRVLRWGEAAQSRNTQWAGLRGASYCATTTAGCQCVGNAVRGRAFLICTRRPVLLALGCLCVHLGPGRMARSRFRRKQSGGRSAADIVVLCARTAMPVQEVPGDVVGESIAVVQAEHPRVQRAQGTGIWQEGDERASWHSQPAAERNGGLTQVLRWPRFPGMKHMQSSWALVYRKLPAAGPNQRSRLATPWITNELGGVVLAVTKRWAGAAV